MALVRATNSTYIEMNRNIKILEKEDILTDKRVGRMRIIKLIRENQKTILLLQALKILTKQPTTKPSNEYLPPVPDSKEQLHCKNNR